VVAKKKKINFLDVCPAAGSQRQSIKSAALKSLSLGSRRLALKRFFFF
jgi:hypothetical protein